MSTPPYPATEPPIFQTQNLHDDDAQVIDDLVQETNAPADPRFGVVPSIEVPQYKPIPVTRLYTATAVLGGGADPYPLLPEDVNRVTCRIRVFSTNAVAANITYNDFALFADNRGLASSRAQNYLITCHHSEVVDLDGHTGAVWVVPGPGMTAAIEVSAWGVTSYDR